MNRKTHSSHPAADLLTALIRDRFSQALPGSALFSEPGEGQWNQLFDMAARQGVLSIARGAICAHDLEQSVPHATRIKWALSVSNINARFERQSNAANKLAALLRSHGIRMMIFKGIALSRLYPVPRQREFGDLDIYLFGDHAKADGIMESLGIEVGRKSSKHSVFVFDGATIENHCAFTNCSNIYEKEIEKALEELAPAAELTEEGYFVPTAEFDILLSVCHSAHHFLSAGKVPGIRYRHLLDWGVLLANADQKTDIDYVVGKVTEAGFARFWNAMCCAAGIIIGCDFSSRYIPGTRGTASEDACRLIGFIIRDGDSRYPSGRGFGANLRKTAIMFGDRGKYRLAPQSFIRHRLWPAFLHKALMRN